MTQVNKEIRTKISDAIKEIEKKTDDEIVCVITQSSARYILYPIITAALLALILPLVNIVTSEIGYGDGVITFQIQSLSFLIFVALFTLTPFRLFLTPRTVLKQRCRTYALEQFFSNNLHETEHRGGIMLFVSLDEKYVDIIADKGINDKVDKEAWEDIITSFVQNVKSQKIEEGFLGAIQSSGSLLIEHFSFNGDKPNELPNHLVELTKPKYVS